MRRVIGFVVVVDLFLLLHELGHFLMAKVLMVPVQKFAIGVGPEIYAYQMGGTLFSLGWIPLMGYNEFATDVYNNLTAYKHLLLSLSGGGLSFLTAWLVLSICYESNIRYHLFSHGIVSWIRWQIMCLGGHLLLALAFISRRAAFYALDRLAEISDRHRLSENQMTKSLDFWGMVVWANFFNLSAVPPLDGAKIIYHHLPLLFGASPLSSERAYAWFFSSILASLGTLIVFRR